MKDREIDEIHKRLIAQAKIAPELWDEYDALIDEVPSLQRDEMLPIARALYRYQEALHGWVNIYRSRFPLYPPDVQ